MIAPPSRGCADGLPTVDALLADPAVRGPLKVVLRSWSERDALDAAGDARRLAAGLERRAEQRVARIIAERFGEGRHDGSLD